MRFNKPSKIIDTIWSDRLYGTSQGDYVELTWGNDTIYGGGGNDVIWDLDGHRQNIYPGNPGDPIWLPSDDVIYGGDGNDLVFAGWGADRIYGGAGYDTLSYTYSKSAVEVNLILGRGYGDGNSAARGDVISGFEVIEGSKFDDLFFLGAEEITVSGGYEPDPAVSGYRPNNGNDRFYGGSGDATIYGGGGNDFFLAGSGRFSFFGGDGHDTVSFARATTGCTLDGGEYGIEHITGSAFDDRLSAFAAAGAILRGEGGNDTLTGGRGSIFGGAGHDRIEGSGWLDGGSGNDWIRGGAGDDRIFGGAGNDSLIGGAGRDAIFGGDGDDRLDASGGAGDRLYGDAGSDLLVAGEGSATLFGGAGADTFDFVPIRARSEAQVRIADFQRGLDRIDVSVIDARPQLIGPDDPWPADEVLGDQAFVFNGLAGRSAPAGSLDYRHVGGDTVVRMHTDFDGVADFQLVLTGIHHLTAADFIL
jgi:Ca2+-binding RTX toxin-like protein